MALTREQESLLVTLADAAQAVPRDQRQPFIVTKPIFNTACVLHHRGLPEGQCEAYEGDLNQLRRAALIADAMRQSRADAFDVTAEGYAYARELAARSDEGVTRVEDGIRDRLLNPDGFRKRFPSAASKWQEAESRLRSAGVDSDLTTIGHLCREAMIAFASALVEKHKPSGAPSDPAKTVARLQAVIRKATVGSSVRAQLDALVVYWGTVSDLVQRQEHGATKEGDRLTVEDGRRIVFQTMNVFYELHRSL